MSASYWVWVEHDGQRPRKVALELLGRGRALGAETTAVILGDDVGPVVDAVRGRASRVLTASDPRLATPSVQDAVAALEQLVRAGAPSLLVAGATVAGRDVMPRLAARLGAPLVPGCTEVDGGEGGWVVRRPVQGGKATVQQGLSPSAGTALATVRPNAYPVVEPTTDSAVAGGAVTLGEPSPVKRQGFDAAGGGRVPLEEADVVVCGGRGLGSEADFALVEQLADALGAAVGASRAVVDSRWRPYEEQVGKSGRTVAPALYVAVGISGAVHHTMGMDTSGTVVAINNDASAPIFGVADLGLVGDARQVLPELTRLVEGG